MTRPLISSLGLILWILTIATSLDNVNAGYCKVSEEQKSFEYAPCTTANLFKLSNQGYGLDVEVSAKAAGVSEDDFYDVFSAQDPKSNCTYSKVDHNITEKCCTGYTGPTCDEATCQPECLRGSCTGPNTCTCPDGFRGSYCEEEQSAVTDSLKYCYTSEAGCSGVKTGGNATVMSFDACCSAGGSGKFWGSSWDNSDCRQCLQGDVRIINQTADITFKSCMASGDSLYRTFDGVIYNYKSTCEVLLTQTAEWKVTASTDCNAESICQKKVTIRDNINSHDIQYLEGDVYINKVKCPVTQETAYSDSSVNVVQTGDAMYIKHSLGFTVRVDRFGAVYVTVPKAKRGDITGTGMCGDFDLDVSDEVALGQDGFRAKELGDSNLVTGGSCGQPMLVCSGQQLEKAKSECSYLKSSMFAACHPLVDVNSYYEMCKEAYCSAAIVSEESAKEARCNRLKWYATECGLNDVVVKWRSSLLCPVECPAGMEYSQCGSACPKGCGNYFTSMSKTECNECVPGCQCKAGLVLHNGACVTADKCTCMYNSEVYNYNASIESYATCESCTCGLYGYWTCLKKPCGATCEVVGIGATTTFDGKSLHLGTNDVGCEYTLVETFNSADLKITLDTSKCIGTMNAACVRGVKMTYKSQTVELKIVSDAVQLNAGNGAEKLPYSAGNVYVKKVTSLYYVIEAPGIRILYTNVGRITVKLDPSYVNEVKGVCGKFNHNQQDDFEMPNNAGGTENEFLQAYSQNSCGIKFDIASVNQAMNQESAEIEALYAESSCSSKIPTERKNDLKGLVERSNDAHNVCPVVFALMGDCSITGQQLTNQPGLNAKCGQYVTACGNGYQFHHCQEICNSACRDYALGHKCEKQCVPGCGCPAGDLVTDDMGAGSTCAKLSECTCYDIANKVITVPGAPTQRGCQECTCANATLTCVDSQCAEVTCPAGVETVQTVPTSCRTKCPGKFEASTSCAEQSSLSSRRCYCPENQWEDKDGKCIAPNTCPCYHMGQWFNHMDTMTYNCKDRRCENGTWTVTAEIDCTATCWASGDPHYETFDGKRYKFQGTCSYTFLQQNDNASTQFDIKVQNVLCGSTGVACTKSIEINVNDVKISMVKGGTITIGTTPYTPDQGFQQFGDITLYPAGVFIFVTFDGVTCMWDGGTRFAVQLTKKWQDKVQGLCGNYNGNSEDDFTSSTGIVMNNEIEFGNSWKGSSCGDVVEEAVLQEACLTVNNTYSPRKQWAESSCETITKGIVFEACRNVLADEVNKYYEECLYDACGCDRGGDCECLCTAISNFAEACNRAGQPARWRHNRLCPIQCEYGSVYTPCGSPCPRTCDDPYGTKYGSFCTQVSCVEGCSCPSGYVTEVTANNEVKCMPQTECPCYLDGVKYEAGSQVLQSCMNCSCVNGQFSCDGSNCSRECSAEEFKCVDDGLCVEKKYLCNGIFNCRDGSDEVNNTCKFII